ncbi:response regulator [Neobacillus sp. OS1-32]|uniref:response regulator transcription factor n=1 Tax=Neobacillus sp. OS1-32 TaxID=3070682 RepID=UPI0027DFE2E8|nr:response regulator [Neobacillus sp. OS1-32]WML31510.1 response regulator [Neobacillus sp. OS1-32]
MRIIIVDDEALERKGLSKMILEEMPEISIVGDARNGRVAMELADQLAPDVMMMDIKMPGIDGVQAVKEIRKKHKKIKFIMVSAFNTFEYAKEVMQQGVKEYILKPSRKEDVIAALRRVQAEVQEERAEQMEQLRLRKKYQKALSLINSEWPEKNRELLDRNRSSDYSHIKIMMEKAVDYIEQNFKEAITLEKTAEYVNLTPFYFSKIFKERMGVTFIDYLTELRINYAKEEMKSPEKSLKEICFDAGYKDPNYFSRVFKKITGDTPTEYRHKHIN